MIHIAFNFFDKEAQCEFDLRMQRDCEPEYKRHSSKKGEIDADHRSRGLSNITICWSALWQEDIYHCRRIASIIRSIIFDIVDNRGIRLVESDVCRIQKYLKQVITSNANQLLHDLTIRSNKSGTPPTLFPGIAFRQQIAQAVSQEAEIEVSICETDLRRKQKSEKRKWWTERVEKMLWMIVGVLGTLLVQWLSKRLY